MGRITINGTQAGFSCKKEVSLALWDVKTNRAKGKSEEARTLNQELDNIKAQITRHYQYICDHDSFVTAKKVYNRYVGFSEECHTLMNLFREQLEPYKKKIGIEKAESTYCGLVADYKSLLLFMKSKKSIGGICITFLMQFIINSLKALKIFGSKCSHLKSIGCSRNVMIVLKIRISCRKQPNLMKPERFLRS